MIGCECATCSSTDPRDQRLRPSIVVAVDDGPTILVDTSPDLRQQALRSGLRRLDAILFTHAHADHIMGLDEVRRFNVGRDGPLPCYATDATWQTLRTTFAYAFGPPPTQGGGVPQLDARVIDGPMSIDGVRVRPVPLWHGRMPIVGFRFGGFAYLTDCNGLPDESWDLLSGLDVLVLDGLRHRPHSSHFTVAQALEVIARAAPVRAYLTHICHDLAHAETNATLPAGVALAHDGLSLDVTVEAA